MAHEQPPDIAPEQNDIVAQVAATIAEVREAAAEAKAALEIQLLGQWAVVNTLTLPAPAESTTADFCERAFRTREALIDVTGTSQGGTWEWTISHRYDYSSRPSTPPDPRSLSGKEGMVLRCDPATGAFTPHTLPELLALPDAYARAKKIEAADIAFLYGQVQIATPMYPTRFGQIPVEPI